MVAVLCERGDYEAALALEALWNDLAARYRFSLFCAYPRRLFSESGHSHAFQRVCAAHSLVRTAGAQPAADSEAEGTASRTELRQQVLALQAELEQARAAEHTLRQRERELAEFLDNASEGIHKVADDGTILYVNRAELDLFPELCGSGTERLLRATLQTGHPRADDEHRVLVNLGGSEAEERFFKLSVQPMKVPDGRVDGVIAAGADITEQVRAR